LGDKTKKVGATLVVARKNRKYIEFISITGDYKGRPYGT